MLTKSDRLPKFAADPEHLANYSKLDCYLDNICQNFTLQKQTWGLFGEPGVGLEEGIVMQMH